VAVEVVDESLQLHGGYGYFNDYDIERFYRAAKVLEIYEGTKEVEKIVISRELLGRCQVSGVSKKSTKTFVLYIEIYPNSPISGYNFTRAAISLEALATLTVRHSECCMDAHCVLPGAQTEQANRWARVSNTKARLAATCQGYDLFMSNTPMFPVILLPLFTSLLDYHLPAFSHLIDYCKNYRLLLFEHEEDYELVVILLLAVVIRSLVLVVVLVLVLDKILVHEDE